MMAVCAGSLGTSRVTTTLRAVFETTSAVAPVYRQIDRRDQPAEGCGARDELLVDGAVVCPVSVTRDDDVDLIRHPLRDSDDGPGDAGAAVVVVARGKPPSCISTTMARTFWFFRTRSPVIRGLHFRLESEPLDASGQHQLRRSLERQPMKPMRTPPTSLTTYAGSMVGVRPLRSAGGSKTTLPQMA